VLGTHADLPIRGVQDFHGHRPESIKRRSVVMPIGSHEGAPDVWHSGSTLNGGQRGTDARSRANDHQRSGRMT
jgi:hypothetical protein